MRGGIVVLGVVLLLIGVFLFTPIYIPIKHEIGPFQFTTTHAVSFPEYGLLAMIIGVIVMAYGFAAKGKEEYYPPPPYYYDDDRYLPPPPPRYTERKREERYSRPRRSKKRIVVRKRRTS